MDATRVGGQHDWDRLGVDIRALLEPLVRDPDDICDITQQCLIKLWRRGDTFEGRSSFATWLYSLVRNEFLSWTRSSLRYEKRLGDWSEMVSYIPDNRLENDALDRVTLQRLLAELPAQDRQLLELRYLSDWTSARVGNALGLAPSTVRCRLRNLRQLHRA